MNHAARVRQFYALINGEPDGDTAWQQVVHADWQARPAFPGDTRQIDSYPRAVLALRSAFPDLHFRLDEVIARDGFVAVRSVVTGTHRGELAGLAATGRQVTFTALDIHQIEDDRIVQTWHVEDFESVIHQLRG
jgi:predicted ester cyclase